MPHYYKHHLMFCTNQRAENARCCARHGAEDLCAYAKQQLKNHGIHKPGAVRVSKAGCLGRCALGPTLVIYPEGVWYTYKDEHDIDEIIEQHVIGGHLVRHLLLPDLKTEIDNSSKPE